ncbi:DNA gyrase subunit A [bacterium]|nr:DNA gyrase subunit A [bacterium]|tara:strand:+ start:1690 stop:4218 length:2529 start_codon:yes stop_codon:yes gene_type:complete
MENSQDNLFEPEVETREILRTISSEMEQKYLDYAMSVIVTRALPDVRDGLKPVHRRILYAMNELGLRSSSKFRKSATVVGEVLGKYHPHGDTAVYDSMVRMAQDFAMRYMLVRGQGNFGSIDGDSPAAMRYTEAKMQSITESMLADIEKDTVDFRPNYDGSQKEPVVLPSRVPQLLLNGQIGIAVAMATSIPPHNLRELCNAIEHLLFNPECSIDDLMEFLKGPDFPTGGIIYDNEAIKKMYTTGRGGIAVRAKTEIIDLPKGKSAIIVTEMPYQVNKANLVAKIAELVRDKKIENITDLRDESNREGIRVVIELKKDSYPKKILQQLFKMTQLQTSFNMNMIALVDGIQPRLLNLKQVLEHFLAHRKIVVRRRTEFELKKAKHRAHILEGLKIALDNIDEVIATIKASQARTDATENLMNKFGLSEIQAHAILDMRLQTLAGLERKKIDDEYNELMILISDLEDILSKPERIIEIIQTETTELKEKFQDARRTEIVPHGLSKISTLDTVPNAPMVLTFTEGNYIKRMDPKTFKVQNRGGKGKVGMSTKQDDIVNTIKFAHNHDRILFFTDAGKVFGLRVFDIPQGSRTAKGTNIVNLLELGRNENVTSIMILNNDREFTEDDCYFMATKNGVVKKTSISNFQNIRKSGLIAISIKEGDELRFVKPVSKDQEVVVVTKKGKSIRFHEQDARAMGRSARGVTGIKLKADDEVVAMDIIKDEKAKMMVVMENGLGKLTELNKYRTQKRGGTGVKTANVTSKTGKVIGAVVINSDCIDDLLLISKNGQVLRLNVKNIPTMGRSTQGVYIMRMNDDDKVSSISMIEATIDDEENEEEKKSNQEALI